MTEPRRHHIPVLLSRQIDGKPSIDGSQQAAASTHRYCAVTPETANRGAFAQQAMTRYPCGECVASDRLKCVECAVRAGGKWGRAHSRRLVVLAGQYHRATQGPADCRMIAMPMVKLSGVRADRLQQHL